MDRREYMREYKRRYRAARNANKHDGDAFLSLSCLSVDKADELGHGQINGWALVFGNKAQISGETVELQGDNITSLLDAFKSVKSQNTVFVCNLKVWGRFFVAKAERLKLNVSDNTTQKNTYRVVVNSVGDWLGVELNIDGNRTFIKSFSEIIRTPLDKAYKDFCGGLLRNAGILRTARAMCDIMEAFKKALLQISGGVSFKANTISGYAQKLCEIIAGHGCPEYGKAEYKAVFPTLSRELGDELRAAKVYRGGWNYLNPKALTYTGAGYVLDVHSFYPSIYADCMPFGHCIKVKNGETIRGNAAFKYAIYNVLELSAHLKVGGVPTIQIINDNSQTEYLTEINYTGGAPFMLDDFDLSSLYANYNVDYITIDYAYRFRVSEVEFLKTYANRLFNLKSRCNGDAIGAAAKYLLNSLSGRFGLNSYRREVDIIKNKSYKGEYKYVGELGYLPAAVYINSRGRWWISELARLHKDVFLYSDTDSLIIKGDEIPKDLEKLIGDGLGQLGVKRFTECKFFAQKCYGIKTLFDGWQWTVAGASPQMLKELDAGAYSGQVLRGGVIPKIYPDGTIAFKEREFTLARNMIF